MRKALIVLCIFVMMFFVNGIANADINDGLVAYYPFNGNANDESENENDGVVHGAVLTTDRFGDVDKAYAFSDYYDGDCIIVEDHESLKPQSVTISCFALFESPYGGHLVTKNIGEGNWESYNLFSWPSVNSVVSCIGTNEGHGSILQAPFEHEDLKWHHLVFSFDDPNDIEKIFIDGEVASQLIETQSIDYDDKPLYISGELDYSTPSFFFSGKIDDIRIYNRALNEFEIQALYHEGDWKIKPTFIMELNDQVVCKNDSIVFEVIVEGIPPIHYQWQKNCVDLPGATDSIFIIPNVQPEDGGEYRCIGTNAYGTGTSNSATLSVEFAIPTIIVGHISVVEYQIVLYSVALQEGHTYDFLAEGGNIIDQTENTITVHWGTAGQGCVKLIETSELGCIADTNILNVTIGNLGIDDKEVQNLSVYPNPFTRITTFYYSLTEPSQVSLQIYNAYGQLMDTPVNAYQHKGNHKVQWNAVDMHAGIYLIRLQVEEQVETCK
ncbi:T9SS type A sorting domain-containing protein, partial [bacterium]|nr:T9SS type A sorting domain-containing protein [bacterium]